MRLWTRLGRWAILASAGWLVFAASADARGEQPKTVDYNRDVRPVLARHCFACHGQDPAHREAGLRLDRRDDAVKELKSGATAVVAGSPDDSELIARVTEADESLRMPPKKTGERLSAAEVDVLRRWIQQGATYAEHWALVKPNPGPLPTVKNTAWPRNGIDYWVLARLEQEGLKPGPEADRFTLLRRASLDLRGLPPTPQEVRRFAEDRSEDAYEKAVDRFLADSAYGERWARLWLDLARYADSAGYGSDPLRTIWRYRDWVIDAFNRNLPYDQFTVEQIAGDLLPNATLEQRMATAFHRNTMTNTEGGTDDEEFRSAAIRDRVDSTWQVWMGLTMGCAKCHSHKYDPLTNEEYYSFYAVFNQTADSDKPDESPVIPAPTAAEQEQTRRIDERVAALKAELDRTTPALEREQAAWESTLKGGPVKWTVLGETPVKTSPKTAIVTLPIGTGPLSLSYQVEPVAKPPSVRLAFTTDPRALARSVEPASALAVVDTPADRRSPAQRDELARHFRTRAASLKPARDEIARLEKSRPKPATLPVMVELPKEKRRESRVLIKSNFLNPGAKVEPGVPASLPPLPAGAEADRLTVARWLVSPENPLTARVAVNRYWAQLFGAGIVETEEDFGTQGELPSHPGLLDWLAVEYMRLGWDTKAILREMVTSATYRQSSHVTPEILKKDPRNRLLTRGPRFRLEAEMVRDQALALSGLLSRKVGGPSVFPPQPEGLWQAAFNGQRTWSTSQGEDRHRRGLYTFWRRTVPYPSMATFDAPSREICSVKRTRTNTPLQAFVTLNDPVYVEAAQALARRIAAEGGSDPESRARYALTLVLARPAAEAQVASVLKLYQSERDHYAKDPAAAKALATEPLGPLPAGADAADLAAWTTVANILLNLDAVLTKG
ncbi:MAG: DUF1553 domain-containing protein [Isosphaeraceae bacterium]